MFGFDVFGCYLLGVFELLESVGVVFGDFVGEGEYLICFGFVVCELCGGFDDYCVFGDVLGVCDCFELCVEFFWELYCYSYIRMVLLLIVF